MQNANQNNARLEIIRASEIEPKDIEWLWYPFVPYGKVTLLQGAGDGVRFVRQTEKTADELLASVSQRSGRTNVKTDAAVQTS